MVVKPRLFVYGIFLGEGMRERYHMTNPEYCTVPGYITKGDFIVTAEPTDEPNAQLTGLLVTPDESMWEKLDQLEQGYDRVLVETTSVEPYVYKDEQVKDVEAWIPEVAFMYVAPQFEQENHSTYKATYKGAYNA